MSLSDINRKAFLAGFLALAGCGYQPVYRNEASRDFLQNQIAVDPPTNPDGFQFVRRLERSLGQASAPKYRLAWSLNTRQTSVGVATGQRSTRNNLVGTARYVLTDIETGKTVTSGTVESFTGFTTTSVSVGTSPTNTNAQLTAISGAEDASNRLATILADQVLARLTAFAGTRDK